jgi:DNA-binding transcriptional ArsR family regulator
MPTYETVAEELKLMGHPLRLQILTLLQQANRTVSELATLTGAESYAVSVNLNQLKGGGLVKKTRDGKTVTYSLTQKPIVQLLNSITAQ